MSSAIKKCLWEMNVPEDEGVQVQCSLILHSNENKNSDQADFLADAD